MKSNNLGYSIASGITEDKCDPGARLSVLQNDVVVKFSK